MVRYLGMRLGLLVALVALIAGATGLEARADEFSIAKIYWEYNSTPNDLGVHVSLDGEDWRTLQIVHPNGSTIMEVTPSGAYSTLGLTELFFEGAEPALGDGPKKFPLAELLTLFPEGTYTFIGETVDGTDLENLVTLSHAIPAGPVVSSKINGNAVEISWQAVTGPPTGFPQKPITIVGYQVIVESFQVTLPASSRKVTVPPEYVASLPSGAIPFEVLAIEASGNQTITEGSFRKKP